MIILTLWVALTGGDGYAIPLSERFESVSACELRALEIVGWMNIRTELDYTNRGEEVAMRFEHVCQ